MDGFTLDAVTGSEEAASSAVITPTVDFVVLLCAVLALASTAVVLL